MVNLPPSPRNSTAWIGEQSFIDRRLWRWLPLLLEKLLQVATSCSCVVNA